MEYSKMNTRQLLAEYRMLKNDIFALEYYGDNDEEVEKELNVYRSNLKAMKKELDSREHIKNKKESKEERQKKAKKHRGGRSSHKRKG